MRTITALTLARKLWLTAALVTGAEVFVYALYSYRAESVLVFGISIIASTVGSIPAFIALIIVLPLIRKIFKNFSLRMGALILTKFVISAGYAGIAGIVLNSPISGDASLHFFILTTLVSGVCVFAATMISLMVNLRDAKLYFSLFTIQKQLYMQTESQPADLPAVSVPASNKLWIKALITGVLILVMLIPTVYVSNLVYERQERQEEVKNEVSSKWAREQTITFPYLFIPYHVTTISTDGKANVQSRHFTLLPENLNVNGSVSTEQRQRSIYRVLLYNSNLGATGNFAIKIPEGVDPATIDWTDVKICMGISDFKGIQERINAGFNNRQYELTAGLPSKDIDETGLSAPVVLTAESIGKEIPFELSLKLKGSDQLHFVPMAGNSHFVLRSDWISPSFDGNTLPGERQLSTDGFEANWNFNKANLPFNTVLKEFNFKKADYAFGVTLLQPTDQYAKTLRCVKYAILFIGLSFSLFFIVEVMQKKPFHPVQYVLVGLALIVFYTLLLSISEFLLFDIAYLVAAAATVLLITLYAKTHFKSWKVAVYSPGLSGAYTHSFLCSSGLKIPRCWLAASASLSFLHWPCMQAGK